MTRWLRTNILSPATVTLRAGLEAGDPNVQKSCAVVRSMAQTKMQALVKSKPKEEGKSKTHEAA